MLAARQALGTLVEELLLAELVAEIAVQPASWKTG